MPDTETKTTKTSLRNISGGIRGVNLGDGSTVYVGAGEPLTDVELTAAELKSAMATGNWTEGKGESDGKPTSLKGLDEAQLRAVAAAEGVNLGDKTKPADLAALIEVDRAAKAEAAQS